MELQIISATGHAIDVTPDPELPYEFSVVLSPPGFMSLIFVMRYGGAEILVLRVRTRNDALRFILNGHPSINEGNPFLEHPRMSRVTAKDGEELLPVAKEMAA